MDCPGFGATVEEKSIFKPFKESRGFDMADFCPDDDEVFEFADAERYALTMEDHDEFKDFDVGEGGLLGDR